MSKTKFFHVQIAHWGYVPILNRRGPIQDVELTAEQINTLRDEYNLELLNPYTGKRFEFPSEVYPGGCTPTILTTEKGTEHAPARLDPEKTEPDMETPPPAADDSVPVSEPAQMTFDPNWFENFEGLSKNKQKKIRAKFAELNGTATEAEMPELLRAYLVELQKNDPQ